eukprot:CAMPEP_0194030654 /NCGR_PEP_ID=MMETSP0009_2-20130614/4049_1 /TAXON_ID=210454 /ORGANISM="Grammatophora oceanica, Strain CCMP 410" /LENGTH=484 /DNA_ID=CAMNT_0038670633 /DNA_START=129 /DNA_END=1583 /DNA_ORIENTATION=+
MMVYPQLFVTDDNDPQNAVRRVQQEQNAAAAGNANFRGQMQQQQQQLQQQQQQQQQQRSSYGSQQGQGMGGMGGMGGMAGGGMMPGMAPGSMGGMQNSAGMMDMLAAMQQGGGNPAMQQGGPGGMPGQFGQAGSGLSNDPSLLAMQQQRILQMQAQQMQMQQQLMRLQGMNMSGGTSGQGNPGGMDALWKAQAGAANPFFMGNQTPLNQPPNEGTFMGSDMLQQVERLKRRRSSGAGGQSMGPDTPPQKRPTSFMPGMMGNPFGSDIPGMDDRKPSGFGGLGGLGMGQHSAPVLPTSSKKRKAKTFPVKFMQALVEHPNEDAVAWLPDGKSFVIVQPDLFVENVLKHMFKECKYASFVRKLHRWGFVRLTSGTGTDCFHHPLFQKDRMDLCQRIVCTPREGSSGSKSSSAKALQQQQRQQQHQEAQSAGVDKPPSLAGVEKFFRQKHSMDAKAVAALPSKPPSMDDPSPAGGEDDVAGAPSDDL